MSANKTFPEFNPYTNEVIGNVPDMPTEDIDAVMERAYLYRCSLSCIDRAAILRDTAKEITHRREEFQTTIRLESGLCLRNTQKEVRRALNCLEFGALQAEALAHADPTAEFIKNIDHTAPTLTVIKEPVDLIVGITPFNHPLNMVAHKIVPAIAAGAAMVLKPSEKTPLSAILLREVLVNNGMPEEMLSIVTNKDPSKTVDQLICDARTDIVTFTGSLHIGKYISRTMATNGNELKRYIAELGGNATFVVMDDCDIEHAAAVALAAFENSGQRCTCPRKILLSEKIATKFMERFVALTADIKYGDPSSSETDMGTLITEEQAKLIESRVNDAVSHGAKIAYGNIRDGALYSPTIIDHVLPGYELAELETFGPIVSVIRINDIEDAIRIIRQGRYRLASAIATKNKETVDYLQREIAVGQFSWNGPPGYRTEVAPFGGFGDSGNGEKEGVIMTTQAYHRIRTFYDHNE